MICRKATVALPDANPPPLEHKIGVFVSEWVIFPGFWVVSSTKSGFLCAFALWNPRFRAFRAQNLHFCVRMGDFSWILGRFEHKIRVFVRFWLPWPRVAIVRSSILPQIPRRQAKRKIADSLVVTISDSLRGVTRNRTGDTRIFSPLLYQLSYDTIAFGIAKIDIFFIIPTICENIFYCCIFTELFLILFEGE